MRNFFLKIKLYLLLLRPLHWVKNVLIFAAPFFAGVLFQDLIKGFFAFIAWCAASSLVYVFNDWKDRGADSLHVTKKSRPFASQNLGKFDLVVIVPLLSSIIIFSSYSLPINFRLTLLLYLTLNFFYSLKFKNVPVIEIIFVVSGFLIRCVSGAIAFQIVASTWFVIFSGYSSLFVISIKRLSEFKNLESDVTRSVLKNYSEQFLSLLTGVGLSISLLTYALWTFTVTNQSSLVQLSNFTLLVFFLRFAWLGNVGSGERPERMIFSDGSLFASGLTTVMLVGIGVGI